jgi:hypothetical protein
MAGTRTGDVWTLNARELWKEEKGFEGEKKMAAKGG